MTEQELRDDFTKMLGKYGLSDEQIDNLQVEILVLVKKYLPELAKEAGYIHLDNLTDEEKHLLLVKLENWRFERKFL